MLLAPYSINPIDTIVFLLSGPSSHILSSDVT